jgi:hypothetical protein
MICIHYDLRVVDIFYLQQQILNLVNLAKKLVARWLQLKSPFHHNLNQNAKNTPIPTEQ